MSREEKIVDSFRTLMNYFLQLEFLIPDEERQFFRRTKDQVLPILVAEEQRRWDLRGFDENTTTLIQDMSALTDEQRMEVIGNFCRYCGCKNPRCQCWNDE